MSNHAVTQSEQSKADQRNTRSRTTAAIASVRTDSAEKLLKSRTLVGFPQLCAITKAEFDPSGWTGWAEAVKTRCAQMGYAYSPEDVQKAMKATQHAHRLEFLPSVSPSTPTSQEFRPLSHEESVVALGRVLVEVRKRIAAKTAVAS